MTCKSIFIHTDGSSNQQKSIGGWAFCLSKEKDGQPFYQDSGQLSGTHNTAELAAVTNALHYVYGNHTDCTEITIFTDSKYVSDPFYFDSIRIWEERGWVTNGGKDVANVELWKEISILLRQLKLRKIKLEVRWVKGHAGNLNNERMDKQAVHARKNGKINPLYG